MDISKSRMIKKKKMYLILVLLVCIIGVGFAILSARFQVNGVAKISAGQWSVIFKNVDVKTGSVTTTGDNGAKINAEKDTVTFTVTLKKPGDFYEFTVDIANEGSIDAMIERFEDITFTDEEKKFLEFDVRYANGVEMKLKDIIESEKSEKIRVRLSFRRDIVASDLESIPSGGITKTIEYKINYQQADLTATEVDDPAFSNLDWRTISTLSKTSPEIFHVGDEKEINMGSLGTHIVRIANLSTTGCNADGFSQTACGFVVEFKDIIAQQKVNDGTYKGVARANGWNNEGFSSSQMYNYLQKDIYDALPYDLKEVMIKTKIVSSRGSDDTNNFTTHANLYLLSSAEVWQGGATNDTSNSLTKQLDYYASKNVTTSSGADATKKLNNTENSWWLRSATSQDNESFYLVTASGGADTSAAKNSAGVSPAFRIG